MKNIILFATVLVSILLAPVSFGAQNAAIYISSPKNIYKTGETFYVNVTVDPKGEMFDTARVALNFPAKLLEIKSFTFGPSFTLQSADNNLDNTGGSISYGAGIPGGLDKNALLGTIAFYVKNTGPADIKLNSESFVLSAGENRFGGSLPSLSYNFSAPEASPKKENNVAKKADMPPAEDNKAGLLDDKLNNAEENNNVLPNTGLAALDDSMVQLINKDDSASQPQFIRSFTFFLVALLGVVVFFILTMAKRAKKNKKNKVPVYYFE